MVSHQVEVEKNVTERWKADMNSDSWLSKNVRPIVFTFFYCLYYVTCIIDSGVLPLEVRGKMEN